MNSFLGFITFVLTISTVSLERIKIITRPDARNFSYFPLASNYLELSVKAKNSAYIVLTNSHDTSSAYYMILLGGWNNTKSVFRKDSFDIKQEYKGAMLNRNGYKSFWIEMNNSAGTISVGKLGKEPFLKYHDNDFIRMSYFGISTGFGAMGEWDFDVRMICRSNCC